MEAPVSSWKDKLVNAAAIVMICLSAFSLIVTALNTVGSQPRVRSEVIHPTKPEEFRAVTAKIYAGKWQGTGIILHSDQNGTDVLTNQHVCVDTVKDGGIVIVGEVPHMIKAIKMWKKDDLCLVHIDDNLHVSTEIASQPPHFGDPITVSGHPLGLPIIIVKGMLSDVVNGGSKAKPNWRMVLGVQVQHGNSGSGVWTERGELIGVVAQMEIHQKKSEFGYGLAVPYSFVKAFVHKFAPAMPWKEVPRVKAH